MKLISKPNILIFLVDQQRGDSIFPYEKAITPNVTAFCKEGLTFAQAHTVAPHCCPSRASLFTGLYPTEHGVWNNVNVGNHLSKGLFEGVRLFSEDLKSNGYRMYYEGKWHVSNEEGADNRGFDVSLEQRTYVKSPLYTQASDFEWKKFYSKYNKPHTDRKNGEILRDGYPELIMYGIQENLHDDIVISNAIDIMKNRNAFDQKINMKCYENSEEIEHTENQPWCQVISTGTTHDTYFVPQRFYDLYKDSDIELPPNFYDSMKDKPNLHRKLKENIFNQLTPEEHKECIKHYLAACSYEDYIFGQVLKQLDETGEKDNTIVLYIADHGDYMGEHGIWCKGLPCFEGAYHIPMAIRWPKGIKNPGRVVYDYTTLMDVAPTLLDVLDIKVNRSFSGNSLKPYLNDVTPQKIQQELYTQSNGNELYGIQRSIKTKKWKLVYNGFDFDELYNLEEDPYELVNVFEQYKDTEIVRELYKKLWNFAREKHDPCINPYITVGLAHIGPGITNED